MTRWLPLAIFFLFLPAENLWPSSESRQVVFEGNQRFQERQLERALRRFDIQLEGDFDRVNVDDAAYFLREFYFNEGFPEARVDYQFDAAGPRAFFFIEEGSRVFLGAIAFEGNEFFTSRRLEDIVVAYIRQATLNPFGRLEYVESAVFHAETAILREYNRNGYLQAQVFSECGNSPASKRMDIRFYIDEGPRSFIHEITTKGLPDGTSFTPITRMLENEIGQPFRPDEEILLRSRVLTELRNAGFYRATITADRTIDPITGNVDLKFEVTPGPIYSIGSIRIDGLRQTRKSAVLRRLGVREGERYDAARLSAGTRRLWFSGAFEEADAEIQPAGQDQLEIKLEMEEGRAKEIRFEAGYGEWDLFFGSAVFTDRNFFGTLNRFEINTFVSTRRYGVSLELADPFLFNSETTGKIGAVFLRQSLPAYRAYFLGGFAALERQYETTRLTGYRLGYQWKAVFNTQVLANEEFVGETDLDYTVGLLNWEQILDRRNSMLIPMQGYLLRYETGISSQATGGEISYYQLQAQATGYLPLMEITEQRPYVPFLMANHRAGISVPFANTRTLPLPERFYLGGPDTVRSYQFDGMPPSSGGVPIGGQTYWVINLEAQAPVYGPFFAVVFSDIGNLSPAIDDYEQDNTRVALGAGLRLYTPIGAVRVDYGYNVIQKEGDPVGAWQFGFGFTF